MRRRGRQIENIAVLPVLPGVQHTLGVLRRLFPFSPPVCEVAVRHLLEPAFREESGLGRITPTWVTVPALRATYVAAASLMQAPEEAAALAWEASCWGTFAEIKALASARQEALPRPLGRVEAAWIALEGAVEAPYLGGSGDIIERSDPRRPLYENLLRRGAICEVGWVAWSRWAKPQLAGRTWAEHPSGTITVGRKVVPWYQFGAYFPDCPSPWRPTVDHRLLPPHAFEGLPPEALWRACRPGITEARTRGRTGWLIRQPIVNAAKIGGQGR